MWRLSRLSEVYGLTISEFTASALPSPTVDVTAPVLAKTAIAARPRLKPLARRCKRKGCGHREASHDEECYAENRHGDYICDCVRFIEGEL